MSDKQNPRPDLDSLEYLLDEDELVQAVERDFAAAETQGEVPREDLRLQRNWQALEDKIQAAQAQSSRGDLSDASKRSSGLRWASVAAPLAAAILVFLLWPGGKPGDSDPQPIFKGGDQSEAQGTGWQVELQAVDHPDSQAKQYRLDFVPSAQGQKPDQGQQVAALIVGQARAASPLAVEVLWQGALENWQSQTISCQGRRGRLQACVLSASDADQLQQKVQIASENFQMIQLNQCVNFEC